MGTGQNYRGAKRGAFSQRDPSSGTFSSPFSRLIVVTRRVVTYNAFLNEVFLLGLRSEYEQDVPNKSARLNSYDPALAKETGLERVEILETRLLQSYEKAESSKLQALLDEKRIRGLEAQNLRLTGFMSKNKQNLPTGNSIQ